MNIEQTNWEREKQIGDLLSVSNEVEKSQIEVGRHTGRQLRRELEDRAYVSEHWEEIDGGLK